MKTEIKWRKWRGCVGKVPRAEEKAADGRAESSPGQRSDFEKGVGMQVPVQKPRKIPPLKSQNLETSLIQRGLNGFIT